MEKSAKNSLAGITKKHVFYVAVFLVAVFAVFGNKGLIAVYKLRSDLSGITSYNKLLEKENRSLEKEIELLKTDRRYIEHVAKQELGMIGRKEVVYRIEEKAPAK